MRNVTIRMSEVKADDKVFINGRQWLVKKVRHTKMRGEPRVCLRADVASGPPLYNPEAGRNVSFKFWAYQNVLKVMERTCAPCRDSDCDCIFDSVEGA